jgi:type IV fimbrial biogenesis protein FimT
MTTLSRRLGLPIATHLSLERATSLRGITFIELLCTVSIVGILSAIAVPQLSQMQLTTARRVAVNDFLHTLLLARNQSVMLNDAVSVCRSHDGVTCQNQNGRWQDGWIVFRNIDRDQPAERDANEEIIYRHKGWPGGVITSNRLSFSFRPASQGDVNGTVVFCDLHGMPSNARAIIINHTGRPRVSTRDASNQPLQCP